MAWREIERGFEIAELPVEAERMEVERILLARIDSARFRFAVHNAPAGDKTLDGGAARGPGRQRELLRSLRGRRRHQVISNGIALGPNSYVARHGAFVSSHASTRIRDLASEDWRNAFQGAEAAMVSYPLLLAAGGSTRAPKGTGWLANRTFIGEDRSGRIVIGTTKGAFFSLDRLAEFLKQAPLDLQIALNLDGGPVACQAIKVGDFERRSCATWELKVNDGKARMLPPWSFGEPPMPIALAVFAKRQQG